MKDKLTVKEVAFLLYEYESQELSVVSDILWVMNPSVMDGKEIKVSDVWEAINTWMASNAPEDIKSLRGILVSHARNRIYEMVVSLGQQGNAHPETILSEFDDDDVATVLRDIGIEPDSGYKRMVIHVSGGVAETVFNNTNTIVNILDFDNYRDEEDMGPDNDDILCPYCKLESTTFEWNAATMCDFNVAESDHIDKLHQDNVDPDTGFTCPHCFAVSEYKDLKLKDAEQHEK